MRIYNNNVLKILAVVLCVLLTYPAFLVSASALDTVKETTPEIVMPTLRSMMETRSEEKIRVAIWLKDYDTEEAIATGSLPDYQTRLSTIQELERTSTAPNETTRSIETKRAALRLCYEPYTADFGTDFLTNEEKIYCSTYLPIIIAELTPARIEQVSTLEVVESIDYYCDDVVEEDVTVASDQVESTRTIDQYYSIEDNLQFINGLTLRNSMTSSHSINVGILDVGNPDCSSNVFSDNYVEVNYPNADIDFHATNTLEIFSTVAPYASFYCTTYNNTNTSFYVNYIREFDWLISCDVSVISISLQIREEQLVGDQTQITEDDKNEYDVISKYLDRIVHIYDILIIKSAGNYESEGIGSGGMAYNVITVGNYNRTIDSMANTSSYYSGTENANKPDISAPGYFTFTSGNGPADGTSFATPLVAGVATLLMATNSSLMWRPSTVKAILMASTNSDHQYTLEDVEYKYYGSGVIDAENARVAATSTNYRYSGAAASEGSYTEYTISAVAGSVIRISMAFQKVNTASLEFSLGDLDLKLYNSSNREVNSSIDSTNNVEIIEYSVVSSGVYKIRVSTISLPNYGTSTASPVFSVAWSTGGN